MQRVKRRIFSGVVCEQEVFNVSDRLTDIKKAEPRPRFKTEEEREQHKIGISRRKHARLVNENFSPRSLYSTLTLDDENEVHTLSLIHIWLRRLIIPKNGGNEEMKYKVCDHCGAHLDNGETCDCRNTNNDGGEPKDKQKERKNDNDGN